MENLSKGDSNNSTSSNPHEIIDEKSLHYSFKESEQPKSGESFPARILSFRELLKVSWKMFEERLWGLVLLNLLCLLLVLILLGFAIVLGVVVYNINSGLLGLTVIGLIIILAIIALVVLGLFFSVAKFEIVGDSKKKIKESLRGASTKIIPYFKTSILYFLVTLTVYFIAIFMPAVMLGAIVFAFSIFSTAVEISGPVAIIIAILGIVILSLFLFLVLYITILVSVAQRFSFFALIVDGRKTATESIAFTYEMVVKNRKTIISRTLTFALLYFIVFIPFSILTEYNESFEILGQIVNFVLSLWSLMFVYALYMNLKVPQQSEINPSSIKRVRRYAKIGVPIFLLFLILLGAATLFALQRAATISDDQSSSTNIVNKSESEPVEKVEQKIDSDSDGVMDSDEMEIWKTDPNKADTDGDGYKDGEEIAAGYSPLNLGQLDIDSDGVGDATEKKLGTDPNKADTDGDGLSDKEEISTGRNPLVSGD